MNLPLRTSLLVARAAGTVSRRRGRGGTSLPGRVLMRLDRDAIARLAGQLEHGSIVISATNGKTTTAAMAASILGAAGIEVVHNRAGANMAGGVASALVAASHRGRVAGELGLFEVDEFWLERVTEQLRPRAMLLSNLFRDQLDRYGELETIAERWAGVVRRAGSAPLALNADDPLIADLGRDSPSALYFGVEDEGMALAGMAHASDSKHCRRCGAAYRYGRVYLGHLGIYECPNCDSRRPEPAVCARNVALEGIRAARFELSTPAGVVSIRLPLPGLYNVYNALAAAALATTLGVALETIAAGLSTVEPAFGRAETLTVADRELAILLVKNPAGANEVLRTLALEPGDHDLLGVLNDNIADGRDISWIWDADLEALAPRVRSATCAGTRAEELALRLKYAGVPVERISVGGSLEAALDHALAGGGQDRPLYVLPTYTAMLELRELLVRRGQATSSWEAG